MSELQRKRMLVGALIALMVFVAMSGAVLAQGGVNVEQVRALVVRDYATVLGNLTVSGDTTLTNVSTGNITASGNISSTNALSGKSLALQTPLAVGFYVPPTPQPTATPFTVQTKSRAINLPMTTFVLCGASTGPISYTNGTDAKPNFSVNAGEGAAVVFDSANGSPDEDSPICSGSFIVPPDYVSGGSVRVFVGLVVDGENRTETLDVAFAAPENGFGSSSTTVLGEGRAKLTLTPPDSPEGLAAGNTVYIAIKVTDANTMDDPVTIYGVEFVYTSSQ